MTLTHGGLFEGYGGTSMAAALVLGELDTRWVSDIKPASIALLAHHHPDVPNLGDLTVIDFGQVEPVDVLTASWPCQPHSSAGKRLGEADPRALWPHVARAIGELRPRIFLGENVGRITSNGELRRVARSLADLGYMGAWRCLNASDVGAPHRRTRCFVVGIDGDVDAAADPGAAGWAPGFGLGRPAGPATLRDDHATGSPRLTLLKTPTTNLATNGGTQHPDKRKAGGHGPTLADEVEWLIAPRLLPTPSAQNYGTNHGGAAGRTGVVRESLDTMARRERFVTDWREYEPAIRRWERVLGRPAPAPTQPSLRAPHGPQLAPRFVEWMMGLPEGWVTDVSTIAPRVSSLRNAALSLLGDGVVPQQGGAAYRELLAHLLRREAVA